MSARRSRAWIGWTLSGAATLTWLVAVSATGLWPRVVDNWESAATMLFGSFLAGSSPEGGGAVAFPVFTKALEVPGPVARTFGLSIQAVGMTMATVAIVAAARPFHRRSVAVAGAAAIVGFLAALVVVGRPDELWWPPAISSAWVKATFSILLATTSILMVRHLRAHRRPGPPAEHWTEDDGWTARADGALVAVGLLGGLLSSFTGTGANIVLFLFLVVVVGLDPKRALPTAIIVMAAVSVVGFVVLSVLDGQLDVTVVGDRVTTVGGTSTDLDADRADLLGLWLAAVPVVVWGAPLGSLAASLVREEILVRFVAALAAVEVATTVVLVPELRSDRTLMAYLAGGLLVVPAVLILLQRHRSRLFGLVGPDPTPSAAPAATVTTTRS